MIHTSARISYLSSLAHLFLLSVTFSRSIKLFICLLVYFFSLFLSAPDARGRASRDRTERRLTFSVERGCELVVVFYSFDYPRSKVSPRDTREKFLWKKRKLYHASYTPYVYLTYTFIVYNGNGVACIFRGIYRKQFMCIWCSLVSYPASAII